MFLFIYLYTQCNPIQKPMYPVARPLLGPSTLNSTPETLLLNDALGHLGPPGFQQDFGFRVRSSVRAEGQHCSQGFWLVSWD